MGTGQVVPSLDHDGEAAAYPLTEHACPPAEPPDSEAASSTLEILTQNLNAAAAAGPDDSCRLHDCEAAVSSSHSHCTQLALRFVLSGGTGGGPAAVLSTGISHGDHDSDSTHSPASLRPSG